MFGQVMYIFLKSQQVKRCRKSASTQSDNSTTSSFLEEGIRNISLYADDETDESHSYQPLTSQSSRVRPYENVPDILSNLHGTNKRLSARYTGLSGLLADPFTGKHVCVALAGPGELCEHFLLKPLTILFVEYVGITKVYYFLTL
ncbi:unnamed protein product [Rodentolepis nana]|uniref:Kinesin motor domain-containing protein n=1 Tax=Rodentolepis nana TaxID=102285 RepID=A0A0R3TX18_RODNA|nr:unnamed protein product [Rodentolepis nana]